MGFMMLPLGLRRIGVPLTVAVSIALASVCACGHSKNAGHHAEATYGLPRPAFELLTASPSSEQATQALTIAVKQATGRCMARLGLTYHVPDSPTSASAPSLSLPEFPQAYVLSLRERDGYGLFRLRSESSPRGNAGHAELSRRAHRAPQARSSGHPTGQRNSVTVLDGSGKHFVTITLANSVQVSTPTDGCYAVARRSVYGSASNYVKATTGISLIRLDFLHAVESSAAFRHLLLPWSSCMRQRGYDYTSPDDASSHIAGAYSTRGATTALREREIATAVADYRCAVSTSLVAKAISAQDAEARQMPSNLRKSFLSYTQTYLDSLKRINYRLS
jgi:hypothetical protein